MKKEHLTGVLALIFSAFILFSCSKKDDTNNPGGTSNFPASGILYKGDVQIWAMNTDGTNPRKISLSTAMYGEDYPSSSPDGKKIVFVRQNVGVYVRDAQGETLVMTDDNSPVNLTWGYDGRIYYSRFNGATQNGKNYIFSIKPDGTDEKQVSPAFLENYDPSDDHPSLSPDGKKMAFSHNRYGNGGTITVLDLASGSTTDLTYAGTAFNVPEDVISPAENPSWSPDGSKIVFSAAPGYPDYIPRENIYVMQANGSGKTLLASDPDASCLYPSWSADGSQILFQKNFPYWQSEIWVMNADGSNAHALTDRNSNIAKFQDHPCFIGKPI